jgi:hypothetical protein
LEKTAKNFALLDHLQIFAEFLHGLDPEHALSLLGDSSLRHTSK